METFNSTAVAICLIYFLEYPPSDFMDFISDLTEFSLSMIHVPINLGIAIQLLPHCASINKRHVIVVKKVSLQRVIIF